jgi:hypothetical protein
MTFWDGASASAGDVSTTAAPSVVGAGVTGGACGFFNGGAAGVSKDARIREIGGSTVVFFLISPSVAFFCGCFLSISETVSTGARCATGLLADLASAARGGVDFGADAGLCACSAFFFETAGLCATGLRAAGFFAAGFDFVAI